MGGRKENTPFFCPGPHPVQTAPSFPRSFLPLRIGTEALRRVSQQHKSHPCFLPPPPSPQGLNTSVPKLSESGRSPRGHLPVYLSLDAQATAAQMSLEASLPMARRPDQVDSSPSSQTPATPPRWLSTGRALAARYHSRDTAQGPAEPLPASRDPERRGYQSVGGSPRYKLVSEKQTEALTYVSGSWGLSWVLPLTLGGKKSPFLSLDTLRASVSLSKK